MKLRKINVLHGNRGMHRIESLRLEARSGVDLCRSRERTSLRLEHEIGNGKICVLAIVLSAQVRGKFLQKERRKRWVKAQVNVAQTGSGIERTEFPTLERSDEFHGSKSCSEELLQGGVSHQLMGIDVFQKSVELPFPASPVGTGSE